MANVVLKWLGNKLFNGTKMICSIKGNNVKVDKTNLGDLIDVNTEELEEDVERALLGNHVYSTTERVCGEWIDGRNIYERVFEFENPITIADDRGIDLDVLMPADYTIINGAMFNVENHASYHALVFYLNNGKQHVDSRHGGTMKTIYLQYLKNEE